MILDSKKWKKIEELFNRGKTKASPGFLASVNTEFRSKNNGISLPLDWKWISKQLLGEFNKNNFENSCFSWNSTLQVIKLTKFFHRKNFCSYYLHILCSIAVAEK